ncbi:MAG: SDR family NAD(P)-dependent oxidoreductase [Clostridiales bacterium]|nr:SDR family NAD(P)-dependent oxidoreductase [Clostridiales bacterium]
MLKNKTIVITGASSGIGRSILEMLAEAGNNNRIIAASRGIGKLTGFGENVTLFPCDLSNKEGVDALFDKAEALFGKIDVLICNAGAPYYERYDYEDWGRIERIFSLNTFSCMYSYSKYLNHLDGREGHIVFTISAMGEMALPGYALYASTKFAMKGFQQAIRLETPKSMKITCVYPVSTKTNFFEVGGAGHKVEQPFPVQTAEAVAKATIRGIERGKKQVYPCPVYLPSRLLMNVLPPVKSLYLTAQHRMLLRFLDRKKNDGNKAE